MIKTDRETDRMESEDTVLLEAKTVFEMVHA